eukprot:14404474-Alexandrium_andersonii.AAC.1
MPDWDPKRWSGVLQKLLLLRGLGPEALERHDSGCLQVSMARLMLKRDPPWSLGRIGQEESASAASWRG